MHLTKHRMKRVHSFWRHIRQVGVCACIVTLVAIWCMFLVGDCRKYGAQSRHTGITLFCGDGHYPASASIWFNTPENVLQDLYHSPTDDFHYYNLTVFVIAYFFISCLTYGLRISSGIFIPTLLTGACWGRMVGILVISCGSSFNDWGSVGKFALIGSVAQLAGIVRISFSVTCIVAEATGTGIVGSFFIFTSSLHSCILAQVA
jgi:chloride channel 7